MFYGLNKFVKNLLPKRLFYRALLIVAIPVILIQLIITIVFFDSLWIKTNKGMTRALVSEIQTFIEVYSNDNYEKDEIKNIFSLYQDLNIEFVEKLRLYVVLIITIFLAPASIMALWGRSIESITEIVYWFSIIFTVSCIIFYLLEKIFL